MLVVFVSLSGLSVMMLVLKRIFVREGRREAPSPSGNRKARRGKVGKEEAGADGQTVQQPPLWVTAAVAAYLATQSEAEGPTADPWNALVNQYDPWVAGSRVHKRGV
jgi:hypothetical protein